MATKRILIIWLCYLSNLIRGKPQLVKGKLSIPSLYCHVKIILNLDTSSNNNTFIHNFIFITFQTVKIESPTALNGPVPGTVCRSVITCPTLVRTPAKCAVPRFFSAEVQLFLGALCPPVSPSRSSVRTATYTANHGSFSHARKLGGMTLRLVCAKSFIVTKSRYLTER